MTVKARDLQRRVMDLASIYSSGRRQDEFQFALSLFALIRDHANVNDVFPEEVKKLKTKTAKLKEELYQATDRPGL